MPDYRRRSARILLVDGKDRILLLQSRPDPAFPEFGRAWITPGGGVDAGESLAATAVREAREEVGLTITEDDLTGPVAFAAGHVEFSWASGIFRDDFFLVRVDAHEVDTSAMEEFEAGNHLGERWWTLAELETTTERVMPYGLADLLAGLLAGRIPERPVELPWHH